jgi:hypothetical protein
MAVTEYRFVILLTLREEDIDPDGEPRGGSMFADFDDCGRNRDTATSPVAWWAQSDPEREERESGAVVGTVAAVNTPYCLFQVVAPSLKIDQRRRLHYSSQFLEEQNAASQQKQFISGLESWSFRQTGGQEEIRRMHERLRPQTAYLRYIASSERAVHTLVATGGISHRASAG